MNTDQGRFMQITVTAQELAQAVAAKLLTQEEARTVYWTQFEVLRVNAKFTPPEIPA